jgi:hypothetical protein
MNLPIIDYQLLMNLPIIEKLEQGYAGLLRLGLGISSSLCVKIIQAALDCLASRSRRESTDRVELKLGLFRFP